MSDPEIRKGHKPSYDTQRLELAFAKIDQSQKNNRQAFTKQNKDQTIVLKEIKADASKAVELGKTTNGRVGTLETVVAPIKVTHDRFMRLWGYFLVFSPFVWVVLGKVGEKMVDWVWLHAFHAG